MAKFEDIGKGKALDFGQKLKRNLYNYHELCHLEGGGLNSLTSKLK